MFPAMRMGGSALIVHGNPVNTSRAAASTARDAREPVSSENSTDPLAPVVFQGL